MESNIQGLVGAFIAVAIFLSVGVSILGGVGTSFECSGLSGGTGNSTASYTGWAKTCVSVQSTAEQGFALLVVILIVIAAVAILLVVRML